MSLAFVYGGGPRDCEALRGLLGYPRQTKKGYSAPLPSVTSRAFGADDHSFLLAKLPTTLRWLVMNGIQKALAPVFATAGALHFIKPQPFDSIVPPQLPGSARSYTCLLYTSPSPRD